MNDMYIPMVAAALILLASLVSIRFALSVAIVEMRRAVDSEPPAPLVESNRPSLASACGE